MAAVTQSRPIPAFVEAMQSEVLTTGTVRPNFRNSAIFVVTVDGTAFANNRESLSVNAGDVVRLFATEIQRKSIDYVDYDGTSNIEFEVSAANIRFPSLTGLAFARRSKAKDNDISGATELLKLELISGVFNNIFRPISFAALKQLTEINLYHTDIPIDLGDVSNMKLIKLILNNSNYTGDPTVLLNQTDLEELQLSDTANNSPVTDCSNFINLTKLTSFFSSQNFRLTGSLIAFQNSPDLETIFITNTAVDDGLEVVQYLPKLTTLNIRHCNFTQLQLDNLVQLMVNLGSFFTGSGKTLNCATQKTGETLSAAGETNVDILRNSFGWTVVY